MTDEDQRVVESESKAGFWKGIAQAWRARAGAALDQSKVEVPPEVTEAVELSGLPLEFLHGAWLAADYADTDPKQSLKDILELSKPWPTQDRPRGVSDAND